MPAITSAAVVLVRQMRSVTMSRTTHLETRFEIYRCIGRSSSSVFNGDGRRAHHRKTAFRCRG
ncbi:protein of unknown function [Paraburkholderia dioscoreae]|uniref:Uncharacterized protein n=1 Tax=Paraburkholderia dioscoreae TaxID=2604047 RepID=A0A5Q4ZVG2_9BURK|nr:protein of unknown function [Paraburkholderia dioscoreae]